MEHSFFRSPKILLAAWCLLAACAQAQPTSPAPVRYKIEVWADNWFALHVNERYVGEDSVPFQTERSFNAETLYFTASTPFDLNFIIRDYIENETGLEYIGTRRQKIGDGGFIMQLSEADSGKVVATSTTATRCLVIQKAPLNRECAKDPNPHQSCRFMQQAEPAGWKKTGFDTRNWEAATRYTEQQAGVKEGYYDIRWSPQAQLIWTSDLELDNTLLCKQTVTAN